MAAASENPEDCRIYMNISITHLKIGNVNEVRCLWRTCMVSVSFGSPGSLSAAWLESRTRACWQQPLTPQDGQLDEVGAVVSSVWLKFGSFGR
jgi:hypothetical protein